MRNFLDRFGISTKEISNSRYIIKPALKNVQASFDGLNRADRKELKSHENSD